MRPRAARDLPQLAACCATVGVLIIATSCGRDAGNERPASSTLPPISKADFLKEGNAICARGNEQIFASARQPAPGADRDAVETFVKVFVPGIRDQIRQIRALGYPEGDDVRLDAIFADAEAILRRSEKDPTTIDGHAFDDVNRRLTAYGLHVCGS